MSWLSSISLDSLSLDAQAWDVDINTITNTAGEANPSGVHSDAEIDALYVDEQLNTLQRAIYLFNSSHEVQRHSIVNQLPRLINEDLSLCEPCIPHLCRVWKDLNDDEQAGIVDSIEIWIDNDVINQTLCTSQIIPHCLSQFNSIIHSSPTSDSNPDISHAALSMTPSTPLIRLLAAVLKHYNDDNNIITSVQRYVLNSCESIHAQARLVAALIIRELLLYCNVPLDTLRSSACSLCQDTSLDVRRAMSVSLVAFGRPQGVTGSAHDLEWICNELIELVSDEEKLVKQSALSSLCELVTIAPVECVEQQLLPVIINMLSAPPKHLHTGLARAFGSLMHSMRHLLQPSDSRLLHAFFKVSSSAADPELRYDCAFNMPCLTQIGLSNEKGGLFDMQTVIWPSLISFANDNSQAVRICLANQLHMLFSLMLEHLSTRSLNCTRLFKDITWILVKDSDKDVRDHALSQLKEMVQGVAHIASSAQPNATPLFQQQFVAELLKLLLSIDSSLCSTPLTGYRVKLDCVEALASLQPICAQFASSAAVIAPLHAHDVTLTYYDRLIPVLFAHLHSSPAPPFIKVLIATVSNFVIRLPVAAKRNDLIARIIREFGPNARSCYDRCILIAFAEYWIAHCSRRWIRKNAWPHLAKLAQNESVKIVKARLAPILALLRPCLRSAIEPKDIEVLQRLVTSLARDNDACVSDAGRAALEAIEHTQNDAESDRNDRIRESFEDRLTNDEDDMNEAVLKRDQQRERNALLNASSSSNGLGSSNGNAVALMIMKQKKEIKDREKERERERLRESQAQQQLLNDTGLDEEKDSNDIRKRRTFAHVRARVDTGASSTQSTSRISNSISSFGTSSILQPIVSSARKSTRISPTTSLSSSLTSRNRTDDERSSSRSSRPRSGQLPEITSSLANSISSSPDKKSITSSRLMTRRTAQSPNSIIHTPVMPAIATASPRLKTTTTTSKPAVSIRSR